MKKILIYLLLGVSLFACNDSDDDTGARKVNVKNEFRVKEIRGTNALGEIIRWVYLIMQRN